MNINHIIKSINNTVISFQTIPSGTFNIFLLYYLENEILLTVFKKISGNRYRPTGNFPGVLSVQSTAVLRDSFFTLFKEGQAFSLRAKILVLY